MLAMLDSMGVHLEGERRRGTLRGTMQASRVGTLRRPVGAWLQAMGRRLAPELALRPAADCP